MVGCLSGLMYSKGPDPVRDRFKSYHMLMYIVLFLTEIYSFFFKFFSLLRIFTYAPTTMMTSLFVFGLMRDRPPKFLLQACIILFFLILQDNIHSFCLKVRLSNLQVKTQPG